MATKNRKNMAAARGEIVLRDVRVAAADLLEPKPNDFNEDYHYKLTVMWAKDDEEAMKAMAEAVQAANAVVAQAWPDVDADKAYAYARGKGTAFVDMPFEDGDAQEPWENAPKDWKPWATIEGHVALRLKAKYWDARSCPVLWKNAVKNADGEAAPFVMDRREYAKSIDEHTARGAVLKAVKVLFSAWDINKNRTLSARVLAVQLGEPGDPAQQAAAGLEFEEGDAPETGAVATGAPAPKQADKPEPAYRRRFSTGGAKQGFAEQAQAAEQAAEPPAGSVDDVVRRFQRSRDTAAGRARTAAGEDPADDFEDDIPF